MDKEIPDSVLDILLTDIATSIRMSICSGHPINFAGIAAVSLADVVMTPGDGNDYNIADGDISGRKITTVQKASIIIGTTGLASHIVLDDGSVIKGVTTVVPKSLVATELITIPAWKVELRDPI